MQSMAKTLTADDILPLVASLTPQERVRLLHLIASSQGEDEDALAWDPEGWEVEG